MKSIKRRIITLITVTIFSLTVVNCPAIATRFRKLDISIPVNEDIKQLKVVVAVFDGERKFWKKKKTAALLKEALTERYKKEGFQVVGPDEKYDMISESKLEYARSTGGKDYVITADWSASVETVLKAKDGTVLFRSDKMLLYSTSFVSIFLILTGGFFYTEGGFKKSSVNYADFLLRLISFSLTNSMNQFATLTDVKGSANKNKKTDYFNYTVLLKDGKLFQKVTIAITEDAVVVADREGNPTVLKKDDIKSIKQE